MRNSRLWALMLGVESGTVIDGIGWEENPGLDGEPEMTVVARVRVHKRRAGRCGICGRRCPGYDQGERRRWRAPDLGLIRAELEGAAPRVSCPGHGVTVAAVPWARHGAWHTRAFEDTVAWLACAASKTTICELMRIGWRAVGHIITRVAAEAGTGRDPLAGLRRIGIDEISYRKGHKYLIVVVDHDTRLLVWAAPGRDKATVAKFFDALGEDRSAELTHVTADGASFIAGVVTARAPQAIQATDPFHVVSWATDTLDHVRAELWQAARTQPGGSAPRQRGSRTVQQSAGDARALKRTRYVLWKNPGNLTGNQQAKLGWIQKTHPYLYRAWLLKEGLRVIFSLKGPDDDPRQALDKWLQWAARSRIPQFVKLGQKIRRHKAGILASIDNNISNGLTESVNTKIRLITRVAFGFHSPDALIALALLNLGGLRPALPGR